MISKKSGATPLEKKAKLAMEKFGMAPRRVVVGFSGGADSTALLNFLAETLGADNVVAVHVNHGLRGTDADADEEFCRELCEKESIRFIAVHIDVRTECGGVAIEETARKMRYAALIKAARDEEADAIALAHTSGDNAETALFNMARGCGISGLGIPPVREESGIKIIRPLILASRGDVLGYLSEKGLSFVTDKTNFDEKYTRNFIRKNIVPELEKVNAQALKNISSLSERARVDEDFIDGFAKEYVLRPGAMETKNLSILHPAVRCRVIMKAAHASGAATLSLVHIGGVEDLILSGKSGDKLNLPGGVSALVADGKLRFVKGGETRVKPSGEYSISLTQDGAENENLGYRVSFEKPESDKNVRVFRVALPHDVAHALTVRDRRAGDKYHASGMTKTVKKLTTGVPFDARGRRPVFEYGGEIVWYPGSPKSDRIAGGDTAVYYIEKIF